MYHKMILIARPEIVYGVFIDKRIALELFKLGVMTNYFSYNFSKIHVTLPRFTSYHKWFLSDE